MGPIGCATTSVKNYYCKLRNNPEEGSCTLGSDRILKCRELRWSECGSNGGGKKRIRKFDEETLVAVVTMIRR